MRDFEELDELLSRYLDGAADAEEVSILEAMLRAEDSAFAEYFARWCMLHRQTSEMLAFERGRQPPLQ
jgi:anti-sigma factor RsiW